MTPFLCRTWVFFFAVFLAGLMFLSRSFAQIGVSPILITEVMLASGMLTAFISGAIFCLRDYRILLPLLPMLCFVVWGFTRTYPYIGVYEIAHMRDTVLYGYAGFAVLVTTFYAAGYISIESIARYYSKLWTLAPVMFSGVIVSAAVFKSSLPVIPGTDVPIVSVKGGAACCHLCGLVSYYMVGLRQPKNLDGLRFVVLLVISAAFFALTRAGMVAFAGGLFVCMFFYGIKKVHIAFAIVLIALLAWGYMFDGEIQILGRGRDSFSIRRITDNMLSLVGLSDNPELTGTSSMRKEWWKVIGEVTFDGPYFWTGRGFGVNMAAEDGFAVKGSDVLINPHNIHITILARMGVPGLALWVGTVLTFFAVVGRSCVNAIMSRDRIWVATFSVIMAVVVAILLNCSFDTALESPVLGVWFWTMYGVGLATSADYKARQNSA